MAQHGYLGDGYGVRGDHGDDDFYRNDDRDFRGQDRNRERDRNFMFDDRSRGNRDFGRDQDRERMNRDRDHDRGFMDRARDTARSWLSDDDHDDRQRGSQGGSDWRDRDNQNRFTQQDHGWTSSHNRGQNQDRGDMRPSMGGFGNQTGWQSFEQNRQQQQRPSAHPDDHYRSWRDKQMQSLDRDYEDYCREREQQFHSEFDSWRQNRQQNRGQQSTGQGDQSRDNDELLLERSRMGQQGDATTTGTSGLARGAGGDPSASSDGGGAEIGVGSQPGHEPTSVGSGSELAGATGSMINETAGGASGRKKGL
ncbi:hypothetical protein G7077_02000 [Sphingomonas piscis]|uniref:SWFGD domain-containing protein n=1 Tax=Sphingomonas piscis TaxID=2714943 RepID=A0A6G7YM90_9SPHN|nr:hypothetical protein [Sphingomonas piscis]QIK77865.1 hypothetical protein G7077_02000 [Sphingomonas piscis]